MITNNFFTCCLDKKYMLSPHDSNCSASFDIEKVPNLKACKRAAGYSLGVSLYGYKYFEYTVYSADRPKGCYVNGQNIYWNNHPTGGKSSGIRSVCQRGMYCIKAHQL